MVRNASSATYRRHASAKVMLIKELSVLGVECVEPNVALKRQSITFNIFVHKWSSLQLPKEKTLNLTFRTDSRIERTGNLYFEVDHIRKGGEYDLGWLITCTADYVLYRNERNGIDYLIDWRKTQPIVSEGLLGNLEEHVNDEDECLTRAYLVSLDELREQNLVVEDIENHLYL